MKSIAHKIIMSGCLMLLPSLTMAADAPPATITAPEIKPAAVQAQPVVASRKELKIGYVDISRIGMESDLGKSVKAQLIEKKDKLQAKVMAKRKQLDKLKESIEAKLPTYTPQQREAKGKEFQKKVEEFQKLAKESEEAFMKSQEADTNEIFNLIEKTIADYGKTNDFSLIVVKKELLYIGNSIAPLDLTEAILKAINEASKKK